MALSLQLLAYLAGGLVLAYLLRPLFSPLRSIGGPPLARFTNIWYASRVKEAGFEHDSIKLHEKHGPIFRYGPNRYSINNLDALRAIYGPGSKFKKSDWYESFHVPKSLEGGRWNLFTESNIKIHSEQRRVFTSMYSMSALVSFEPFVDQCADLFEQTLLKKAQAGVSFDFGHWLQCYAFDVIGDITFGKRFGFLDNGDDIGGLIDALDTSFLPICILGLFQTLYYYAFQFRYLCTRYAGEKRTGFEFLTHFTQTTIDEYTKASKTIPITSEDENATEPILWKSFRKHEADPDHFTLYHIFSACAMNIGAGSDTTGISLAATFYYLMTNPETMKELRAEMEEKHRQGQLSDRPTFEETQNMPYLQAVIKESLRMHPAVGLPLERIVPEGGAAIAGQFFPAGTIVGVNAWVEHRNKQVWGEDADQFRPERWLSSDSEKLSEMNRHWMPFGAGSRLCIGKNISLLEMAKLVPRVIRDFDLEIEGPWRTRNHWFVKPQDFHVKVTPRKPRQEIGLKAAGLK